MSPSPVSAGGCDSTAGRDPASPSSMPDWLKSFDRASSSGKTSQAYYPPATDSTSEPSSVRWSNAGTAAPGGFWTHSLPEHNRFRSPSPRDDVVCGLSDVLEPTSPRLLKYFLSSRACEGILRRAAKRGKDLPPLLDTALTEMIAWWKAQPERGNPEPEPPKEGSPRKTIEEMELEDALDEFNIQKGKALELLERSEGGGCDVSEVLTARSFNWIGARNGQISGPFVATTSPAPSAPQTEKGRTGRTSASSSASASFDGNDVSATLHKPNGSPGFSDQEIFSQGVGGRTSQDRR